MAFAVPWSTAFTPSTTSTLENDFNAVFWSDRWRNRTRILRLVRAVQARAGRVHRALEHQTAPDTTRGAHPGGVPEHVPRGLGLYPN